MATEKLKINYKAEIHKLRTMKRAMTAD